MNKIFIISIFAFVNICKSQVIFNVEIDRVYVNHKNEITFFNEGETSIYECEFNLYELKDYDFKIYNECYPNDNFELEKYAKEIKINDLYSGNAKTLFKRISDTYFVNIEDSSKVFHFINDEIAVYYYEYNSIEGKTPPNCLYSYSYCFVEINNSYFITCLISEGNVEGYIITSRKGDSNLFLNGEHFTGVKKSIPSNPIDISIEDHYRISKVDGGFILKDNLFQKAVISEVFDTIIFTKHDRYIICKKTREVKIFNNKVEQLHKDKIRVAYLTPESLIQFVNFKNEMYWLNHTGVRFDTLPVFERVICGNQFFHHRRIKQVKSNYRQYSTYGVIGEVHNDSVDIKSGIDQEIQGELLYLNRSNKHQFTLGESNIFSFPNTFYAYYLEDTVRILDIRNDCLDFNGNFIKYDQNKTDCISSIEVKFEYIGYVELLDYNHPIKYVNNSFVGFYPITDTAKYLEASNFIGYFAKIENKDGKVGWLDIYGNEFY